MLAPESTPPPAEDPPPGAGCTGKAVLPLFVAFAAFAALLYALGCISDYAKQLH